MLVIVFLFLTFIAEILGVFRFADLNTWKDAVEPMKATMAIWIALVVFVKGRAPPARSQISDYEALAQTKLVAVFGCVCVETEN